MSRATGTAASVALIAMGALLAFATSVTAHRAITLGWVLMQIGAAGLLVAFMVGDTDTDYPRLFRERKDAAR
ncbi:MAG: hypothetical protein ABI658_26880 [Acidimicrobiales bacterium]